MKDKIMSSLRIILGLGLIYKGVYFIINMKEIFELVSYNFPYLEFVLSHFVVVAHIAGGICIALGLFTRFACLVNIPILLGAIFFVSAKFGFYSGGQEIGWAISYLIPLLVFSYYGSGTFSADIYLDQRKEQKSEVLLLEKMDENHKKSA